MLVTARVEAIDTRPDQLRLALGGPVLPAVAVHRVAVGDARVELRILAASHQVVVDRAGASRCGGPAPARHVETVACGLASGRPLRDGGTWSAGGWTVSVAVERLGTAAFAEVAAGWRERGRDDPDTVVARFPAHPDALTALAVLAVGGAEGAGPGWVGVHTYPAGPAGEGGTVVVSRTAGAPMGARTGAAGGPPCPA
jgi:hypothetical protein